MKFNSIEPLDKYLLYRPIITPPNVQSVQVVQLQSSFNMMKTSAQGLMDFAFLTANASQLRYVLRSPVGTEYRTASLAMISTSIALQVSRLAQQITIVNNA